MLLQPNSRVFCRGAVRVTRSATRTALDAEPPHDKLALAKNPLTEGPRSRSGNVVPLQVLDLSATVADEMVMPQPFRIEARGAAFDGYFTH